MAPLILALPSKGRLKEQCEAFFAQNGLDLRSQGGERAYSARFHGFPDIEIRFCSSSEIAGKLLSGDVHLGVVGEDLLRETSADVDERCFFAQKLGFGQADLVVAVSQDWLDVEDMADLDDAAAQYRDRTGVRMRVATKYPRLAREFFSAHGVETCRFIDSAGATEGAPAAGMAELIVDITTTGATLAANRLKILRDGVILRSQAQLMASLICAWDSGQKDQARRLLHQLEAHASARNASLVYCDRPVNITSQAESKSGASSSLQDELCRDLQITAHGPHGFIAERAKLPELLDRLRESGFGQIAILPLRELHQPDSAVFAALEKRLEG